ncbi:MAG: SDR family oxidoreductase [bacterium]|nr:SDR family oxidoreductase [bacterium]
MKTYDGQRVLITGAARGIGLCTAREFAVAGAELVLTDLDEEALDRARATLTELGATVHARVVDVTQRDQVDELARWVVDDLGGLDVLINNAGVGHMGELAEMSLESWDKLIEVNLVGPLHHVYAFLPHFRQKGGGQIVNISSGQAFFRLPTWGAYAAAKSALASFSEVLHYELKKHRIKVTTVYPFMVSTGFYDGIEGNTWGSRMAMKLVPYYSMTPEKVGRIIFRAVRRGKRVEMVSVINQLGFYTQFIPFANQLIARSSNRLLAPGVEGGERGSGVGGALGRVLKGAWGFRITEVMRGEHEFESAFGSAGGRPMEFSVRWGTNEVRHWVDPSGGRFLVNDLEGSVTIDGLCRDAPCKGTLELRYLEDRTIRYAFGFEADGMAYRYEGQKVDIRPWNLPWSHTRCFGRLTRADTGALVSTSLTRFYLRSSPRFLASLRFQGVGK